MADYSEQQLFGALRKADAAGDTAAAKAIARRIQSMRQATPQAAPADFSDVSSRVDSTAQQPKEDPYRGLKMGVRSSIQGGLGLMGAIGGDAFNEFLVPGQQPTYREMGSQISDRMGLPTPQTSRERVIGDIGEGLTGTALTMGAGGAMNLLKRPLEAGANKLAQLLTAQPKLQAVSTVTGAGAASMTRESGGSQGRQLMAGLAGGLAPGGITATTAATTRGLVRGTSGATAQRSIDDFRALGTTPSVGQATGGRFAQGFENLMGGSPTSAGVMNRFAERQADDIGGGLQKMADNFYRNASGERAGRAVEKGVDTFAGNVAAVRKALYWNADRFIPDDTPLPLNNTQRALSDLTALTPGAESTTAAMLNPKITLLAKTVGEDIMSAQAVGAGGIPYSAVKDIRSRIGNELSDFSLITDKPTAQYKRLYAALSQDMEDAARQQGPDAMQAVKRANTYFKASAERLDQVQRVVDKSGGPEKVFTAVMAGTKDGGTTLRAVMQSLPSEGQRALTAAVIKRMSMANPGMQDAVGEVFSAQTFLRKWNDVSPEAKRALFDRHGPGFVSDMDRVASVAQNLRDGSKVLANPSGTANRAAALTYGASLVASLFDPSMVSTGGLVAGGALANLAARAMTKPSYVKWLAKSTTVPVGSAVAQINALRQIGEKEQDEEIVSLADALSENQPPKE